MLRNILPEKLECVGHGQKRLGTCIQKLVKQHKETSTPLSGKRKLTNKTINSMQNYYNRAIHEIRETCLCNEKNRYNFMVL